MYFEIVSAHVLTRCCLREADEVLFMWIVIVCSAMLESGVCTVSLIVCAICNHLYSTGNLSNQVLHHYLMMLSSIMMSGSAVHTLQLGSLEHS